MPEKGGKGHALGEGRWALTDLGKRTREALVFF